MKYIAKAYIEKSMRGLMHRLDTDSWDEVVNFVWDKVREGLNCEITNNENNEDHWAYAEDFDEEALNPEDLIRDHRKPSNSFYADLLMEQQATM